MRFRIQTDGEKFRVQEQKRRLNEPEHGEPWFLVAWFTLALFDRLVDAKAWLDTKNNKTPNPKWETVYEQEVIIK